ncbi:MAG: hypothetical protein WCZ65_03340 [Lysobacteraceae bacterium]
MNTAVLVAPFMALLLLNERLGARGIGAALRSSPISARREAATVVALGVLLVVTTSATLAAGLMRLSTPAPAWQLVAPMLLAALLGAGLVLRPNPADQTRLARWRLLRRIIVNALLITALSAWPTAHPRTSDVLTIIGLGLLFALLLPALAALHYRVDIPALPRMLAGTPVALLNSTLTGLALYGLLQALAV